MTGVFALISLAALLQSGFVLFYPLPSIKGDLRDATSWHTKFDILRALDQLHS